MASDQRSGLYMTPRGDTYVVINMQEPTIDCHVCGVEAPMAWGLPLNNNAEIVANDWPGEWGGVSVCESCWARHERGELVECPTSDYDPKWHGKEAEA
jgi:hypothetical protein